MFAPFAPIESTHCVALDVNLTQQVSERETAPLIPVLLDESILPVPENAKAAVAPVPEKDADDREKLVPALKPITVFPEPEYDLVFPASIAKITESNEEFFGPL